MTGVSVPSCACILAGLVAWGRPGPAAAQRQCEAYPPIEFSAAPKEQYVCWGDTARVHLAATDCDKWKEPDCCYAPIAFSGYHAPTAVRQPDGSYTGDNEWTEGDAGVFEYTFSAADTAPCCLPADSDDPVSPEETIKVFVFGGPFWPSTYDVRYYCGGPIPAKYKPTLVATRDQPPGVSYVWTVRSGPALVTGGGSSAVLTGTTPRSDASPEVCHMKRIAGPSCAWAGSLLALACGAPPVSGVAGDTLVAAYRFADLVVACADAYTVQVTGVDGPPDKALPMTPRWTARVTVDRVLRGASPKGQALTIALPPLSRWVGFPVAEVKPGSYWLVLLTTESDEYHLCHDYGGSIVRVSRSAPPGPAPAELKAAVEQELINTLVDRDQAAVLEAIDHLGEIGGKPALAALKPLLDSKTPAVRRHAVFAVLRLGDTSVAPEALKCLLAAPGPDFGWRERSDELRAVEGMKDPAAAEALCPALSAEGFADAKRAVLMAFRTMKSRAVVPCVKQALDDPDRLVRYHAVMALALTLRDYRHAPAFPVFESSEDYYINYWKTKELEQK